MSGKPYRFPLAALLDNRNSNATKDSKLKNGFLEKGAYGDIYTYKRPGASVYTDTGVAGFSQGMFSWKGNLYNIKNDILVSGPNNVPVSDGTTWIGQGIPTGFPPQNNAFKKITTGIDPNTGIETIYSLEGSFRNGGPLTLYTSTDNKNWTSQTCTVDVGGSIITLTSRLVLFSGKFWLFGGITPGFIRQNTIYSSTNCKDWTLVTTSAPWSARAEPSIGIHAGVLYLIGGDDASTATANDVWKMNSTTGLSWTQQTASAFPTVKNKGLVGSHAGFLWYVGGISSLGAILPEAWFSSDNGVTWTAASLTTGFNTAQLGNQSPLISYNSKMWLWDSNGVGGSRLLSSSLGAFWATVLGASPVGVSDYVSTPSTNFKIYSKDSGFIVITPNTANPQVWKATINAPGGTSFPLTPSQSGNMFDFSNASFAAGSLGFMFKSTSDGYVFNNNTLTKISNVNYPASTVPGLIYLDGTYYVMNSIGKIYGSNLEDPFNWTSLNAISANQEADAPVALAKQLNYAVAFCENTTQFFYDAANPVGSPLSPVPNAFNRIGCASAGSVSQINGTLFWMGKTNQKGRSIYTFNGISPSIISNQNVDRILNADNLSTVYSFCIRIAGHVFYVITLKSSNITLVCDVITMEWYEWSWMTPNTPTTITMSQSLGVAIVVHTNHGKVDGDPVTIAGATQVNYNGRKNISIIDNNTYQFSIDSSTTSPATGTITSTTYSEGYMPFVQYSFLPTLDLVTGENDGIIYQLSPEIYDDNNNPINFVARTARFDAGTNKEKHITRINLIADKVNSTSLLRYSKDDYQTFSFFRPINMNTQRSQLNRLGKARRRAFELKNTDSVPLRLEALELTLDEGVE